MEVIFMELLYLTLGAVIGFYLSKRYMKPYYAGVLKSVKTDEDEQPTFLLELHESCENVSNNEYVTFKVDRVNYSSR